MLQLVTHPLVHECLAELRDSRTQPERFRALTNRISVLLGAEALRDVPTVDRHRGNAARAVADAAASAPTW